MAAGVTGPAIGWHPPQTRNNAICIAMAMAGILRGSTERKPAATVARRNKNATMRVTIVTGIVALRGGMDFQLSSPTRF
jgi:hypothetical protein